VNTEYQQIRRHWLVAAAAKSLDRKPLGVTVFGTPLVLYRAQGEVVAAEDRCPHRNAPLSLGSVDDGRLRCPYHGWCFDATGRCVEAPGLAAEHAPQARLRRWQAVEADGWIWVAPLDTPAERTRHRPSIDRATYRGFAMQTELEADFADAVENLLDGTHTPFVHAGLVRDAGAKQALSAVVRRSDVMIEAEYRGESGQSGIISRWFEPPRDVSFGRFVPPCTAELEYRSRRRTELYVAAHFTPTTAGRLRVFVACYLPGGAVGATLRYAVVRPFFRHVLKQDSRMLEAQQRNVARFGGRAYVSWTADLMRHWIDAWLSDGRFPEQTAGPTEIHFEL